MQSTKDAAARKSAEGIANLLIRIAKEEADLWHDPSGVAYATIRVGDIAQSVRIHTRQFSGWLSTMLFQSEGLAAMPGQLSAAILIIEQLALAMPRRKLVTRVGLHGTGIAIDFNDDTDNCICIGTEGWYIGQSENLRFLRHPGMQRLVAPAQVSSIKPLFDLLSLLNFDEEQSALVAGWLLSAFNPAGSHFVLVINGESGCGKTTACRTLKQLIDPAISPLRALPKSEEDLYAAAVNNWCLVFDDVSRVPNWLADSLCRLSTGGAFSKWSTHAAGSEIVMDLTRAVMLSGTEQAIAHPDLLARCICIQMKSLSEQQRMSEGALSRNIEKLLPEALGALLNGLILSLARVQLDSGLSGCMADAAAFAAAGSATPGWTGVTFIDAYTAYQRQALTVGLDCSPLVQILMSEITPSRPFEGTATELMRIVKLGAQRRQLSSRDLPVDALRLSGALTRFAPILREVGIVFERPKHGKTRTLKLYRNSQRPGLIDDTTLPKSLSSTLRAPQGLTSRTVDVIDDNSGNLSRRQRRWRNGWPLNKA